MTTLASVIVPTYKRPDLLDCCLAALVGQEFDPAAFEVIVADDAASAQTMRQVERWAGQARPRQIRYLPVTHAHGPAAARNAGWRAACGQVIAFTDDDCLPQPGWLRAGVNAFLESPGGELDSIPAAWGKIVVPLPPSPTDYERSASRLASAEFVTANCFCRRDVLESLGGFDERFRVAWREDADLLFSLIESGRPPVHVPEAVVIHPIRPAPWGISLKQERKGLYNALLYKKHPRLYRQKIRSGPKWDYYAMVLMLLAASAGLALGSAPLATVTGAAWVFLTGHFCLRRLHRTSRRPRHLAEMVVTSALIPPLSLFWHFRGAFKFRVFFL